MQQQYAAQLEAKKDLLIKPLHVEVCHDCDLFQIILMQKSFAGRKMLCFIFYCPWVGTLRNSILGLLTNNAF